MDLSGTTSPVAGAEAVDPERYALGGVAPARALRPASREEVAEVLRAAARDRRTVVPWGGGVGLRHETPPARYGVALDLGGLDRIVEYEPEDLTLTAECGVTLATLRATLAARGQELPLEAPREERTTLGGTLAANAVGPRRRRFGSPRDRILGARFALGDGTLARSGGKVVKNVAGYGIHRLLCGSRGGLAVLLEASLKLHPAPETRRALVYPVTPEAIADRERWARFPGLEPAALTILGGEAAAAFGGGEWLAIVGLEGDTAWIERQSLATHEALGQPPTVLDGEQAAACWRRLADLEDPDGTLTTWVGSLPSPSALPAREGASSLVFDALAGRLQLVAASGASLAWSRALLERGFQLVEARGEEAIERGAPPSITAAALRARIRAALDPDQTMAFGPRWESGGLPGASSAATGRW